MEEDSGFNQFRVTEIVEIEFEARDRGEEAIARFFLRSRKDAQIALEVPFSMWAEISDAIGAGLKELPDGGRRQ
jgi:hypothetical protein